MSVSLSVVMPVYNEAAHLPVTIDALVEAVKPSGFDAEVVLVDDGSTDGSADVAVRALRDRLPITIVARRNCGRFAARRAGLELASGENALLLDGRVRIHRDALAFVRPRVEAGENVWTGHVYVADGGQPFGIFWRLLAELAWNDYFDNPRTTSFGADEFDRFPKGTTCLLAPRGMLVAAMDAFQSKFADTRHANDDTPLVRWIAERTRIHVSPQYAASYNPRTTLMPFLRHAHHRGIVFVDGHGRLESRFFSVVVAFYPASLLWAASAIRRPWMVPATIVGLGALAGAFAASRGKSREAATALALTTPVYAAAHGAGMWAGLMLVVRDRLRGRHEPP